MSHRIINSYDACTVAFEGYINNDGDFVTLVSTPDVTDIDGDNDLWCIDCNGLVFVGDGHGLSEEWQAL